MTSVLLEYAHVILKSSATIPLDSTPVFVIKDFKEMEVFAKI